MDNDEGLSDGANLTNESVLFTAQQASDRKALQLSDAWKSFLSRYGTWENIPKSELDAFSARVASQGCSLDPATGVWPANSADLSSF